MIFVVEQEVVFLGKITGTALTVLGQSRWIVAGSATPSTLLPEERIITFLVANAQFNSEMLTIKDGVAGGGKGEGSQARLELSASAHARCWDGGAR
eukprot:2768631-Rhodomonas_salina.2